VLTPLEVVEQLLAAYPHRFPSPGWVVRALPDRAIDDVVVFSRKSSDERSLRVAQFLELRRQGQSVTAIAQWWGLTRECVSRTISHKAILLVTDRLLQFGKASLSEAQTDAKQRPATSGEREKQGA
jgi:hypothetical protein